MERSECNRNCWISAAIAGVVVLLFVSGLGDLHWLGGLFLGAMTCLLLGALLVWLLCHDEPGPLPGRDVTNDDWQRQQVHRQPESLLVSGGPGPERPGIMQMPIVAGALPRRDTAGPGDDLQRIKGIGPKLSDWLTRNGVTRYAQIADWDAAAVAGFSQRLGRMGGRIEADDWVGQARLLAAGGETEHSRRVDAGGKTGGAG